MSSLNQTLRSSQNLSDKMLLFHNSLNAPVSNDSIWFQAHFLYASSSQSTSHTAEEIAAKKKTGLINTWNMLSLKPICFVSQVVGFYRCSFHKIVAMNHTSALQELAHASVQRCQTFVSRTLSEMSFAITFSTRMHSSVRYVWPRSRCLPLQKIKTHSACFCNLVFRLYDPHRRLHLHVAICWRTLRPHEKGTTQG